MKCEDIKKILDKYEITTLDQLEYCLSTFDANDECLDDPADKNCTNAKCYEEFGVPDCRKIVEIYKKYFQKELSKKELFVDYIEQNTSKSKSSIANYLSCKSCNQQIKKGIQNSLKISDSDFKKDFCNNLSLKFDYDSLFAMEYNSIKQFLNVEHQITSETFVPKYSKEKRMTQKEEKKLFDIVHTSRDELKTNLKNEENLTGSDQYIFSLANYAFDRNLVDECESLIHRLEKSAERVIEVEALMHLKAKVLSSKNKNKEAIKVLEELIELTKPKLDAETNNLLAASTKREAFDEYQKYSDVEYLVEKLTEAKDRYHSVYALSGDYYPALNYIYLTFILAHINNEESSYFENLKKESKEIWDSINHKVTDWWSFISNIEFLILIGQYEEAKSELESHFQELDKEDITDFNIASTLRQLHLYNEFYDDKRLKEMIEYIEKFNYSDSHTI